MPRYRVTLRRTTIEIVEAPNPFQAAIVANDRGDGSVEITDVRPAFGRPSVSQGSAARTGGAAKTTKKVAKKRKPLSPEARAKLAQNLVKARAARAAKRQTTQRTTKKAAAKKTTRAAAKKR
jgi:hypothetical protein